MFELRKRILVFDPPPIDNGSHIQQNNMYILPLCNAYQIYGYGCASVLSKCAAKLINQKLTLKQTNFISNSAFIFSLSVSGLNHLAGGNLLWSEVVFP